MLGQGTASAGSRLCKRLQSSAAFQGRLLCLLVTLPGLNLATFGRWAHAHSVAQCVGHSQLLGGGYLWPASIAPLLALPSTWPRFCTIWPVLLPPTLCCVARMCVVPFHQRTGFYWTTGFTILPQSTPLDFPRQGVGFRSRIKAVVRLLVISFQVCSCSCMKGCRCRGLNVSRCHSKMHTCLSAML
jgi:hypothetical protein